MKSTDDRRLFGTLIGASAATGNIATIPATQGAAGDGTASIALAFPPETFIARAAGGEPPRGADMNGFLNLISSAVQVLQAGYLGPFDAAFAAGIGGYPAGAVVSGSTAGTFWVSTADANTTVPGAGGANWKSLFDGLATQSWAQRYLVHSGGGAGGGDAGSNVITLAWVGNKLHLGVDNTDIGNIASENWTNANFLTSATAASTYATQSALAFEASARQSADSALGSALASEASARASADTALQNSKQNNLGFTPVQQGGGANQSTNKIYLGWGNTNHLRAQVDTTDVGNLAFTSDLPTSGTITGGTYTKTPMNDGTGRSVLRQDFCLEVQPDGNGNATVAFPIAYSEVPSVSVSGSQELPSGAFGIAVSVRRNTAGTGLTTTTTNVPLYFWWSGGVSTRASMVSLIVEGIA